MEHMILFNYSQSMILLSKLAASSADTRHDMLLPYACSHSGISRHCSSPAWVQPLLKDTVAVWAHVSPNALAGLQTTQAHQSVLLPDP